MVALLCLMVFGIFCLHVGPAEAIRNICDCGAVAELPDITCRKCQKPLNKCLACGTENPVSADFCTQCGEMLAEMRVLAKIDPELREELRLGQSDRAQLDRELARLNNLLETEPDKAETYLYRRAKVYNKMSFWAREANEWKDYLEKFPQNPRKNRIKALQSEALRKWGNLFYHQNEMKQAQAKFLEAANANPMNVEAWRWLGRVLSEQKDPNGAAEAYLSALKAKPGDSFSIQFLRRMKKTIPADLLKPAPSKFIVAPPENSAPASAVSPAATAAPAAPVPGQTTQSTQAVSSAEPPAATASDDETPAADDTTPNATASDPLPVPVPQKLPADGSN
jgi:tetratricopeptide (TPR) repeat protein